MNTRPPTQIRPCKLTRGVLIWSWKRLLPVTSTRQPARSWIHPPLPPLPSTLPFPHPPSFPRCIRSSLFAFLPLSLPFSLPPSSLLPSLPLFPSLPSPVATAPPLPSPSLCEHQSLEWIESSCRVRLHLPTAGRNDEERGPRPLAVAVQRQGLALLHLPAQHPGRGPGAQSAGRRYRHHFRQRLEPASGWSPGCPHRFHLRARLRIRVVFGSFSRVVPVFGSYSCLARVRAVFVPCPCSVRIRVVSVFGSYSRRARVRVVFVPFPCSVRVCVVSVFGLYSCRARVRVVFLSCPCWGRIRSVPCSGRILIVPVFVSYSCRARTGLGIAACPYQVLAWWGVCHWLVRLGVPVASAQRFNLALVLLACRAYKLCNSNPGFR